LQESERFQKAYRRQSRSALLGSLILFLVFAPIWLWRSDTPDTMHVRARGVSGRWFSIRASLAEPDATGECAAIVLIQPAVPREVASVLTSRYDLSRREREVVAAVTRGETTKAIAESLGVSPHTVIEHIERACRKIGVRGRKALIAKLFFDGSAPVLAKQPGHGTTVR